MAKKVKEEEQEIKISLNLKTIEIPIVGVSSLIVNRFEEKSKEQLKEIAEAESGLKQGGKKKHIGNPDDYKEKLYIMEDGTFGFPAGAFKNAMVTAAYRMYGYVQTKLRSVFHVLQDGCDKQGHELVRIYGEYRMREDMVRVGPTKVASPRYRPEFPSWSAVIKIRFLDGAINEEQLVGMLNAAGFGCGIGEWRPEKTASGSHGMFRVANTEEEPSKKGKKK